MPYINTQGPELSGFDTGLCLNNLSTLAKRHNTLQESLLAVLSELADAILTDSGGDPDTVNSILLSLLFRDGEGEEAPSPPEVAPINREELLRMNPHTGLFARLALYAMLEERMASAQSPTPLRPTTVPGTAKGRIAYMPSAFADKAYLILSTHIPSPRAGATTGFVDACEEVRSGLCEYCILPVENTQSGKLTAFSRLILRYRLRIVTVCDLEDGSAEGQFTRFALLKAATEEIPTLTDLPNGSTALLEILHNTGASTLSELLTAAEFCGLSPVSIHTLPPSDTDLEGDDPLSPTLDCVFSANGADLSTFFRYLFLEASEDFCAGLYSVHR